MGKLLEVLLLFIGVISLINAIINLVRGMYEDKDEFGNKGALYFVIAILCLLSHIAIITNRGSTNLCEYKLHLYYIGGTEKNVVIESTCPPYAEWQRNSFILYYKRGFSLHKIYGVVRYKVLSKKEIKQLSFKEKMKQ